jgi:hypothetical protein
MVVLVFFLRRLNRLLERHTNFLCLLAWNAGARSELAIRRGSGIFTIYPHVDLVGVETELRKCTSASAKRD